VKQPKYIQNPQNHGNHHNAIQNGLDSPLHGDVPIYKPEKNADYNQDFQQLN
jgi:hypothetical protein